MEFHYPVTQIIGQRGDLRFSRLNFYDTLKTGEKVGRRMTYDKIVVPGTRKGFQQMKCHPSIRTYCFARSPAKKKPDRWVRL